MRRPASLLVVIFALGCEGDELPLGGPYGGNTELFGPNDGGYPNVDATYKPPIPPRDGNVVFSDPPAFNEIYAAYLGPGTIGYCTDCHPEMSDAPASFTWLEEHGYVGSPDPLLTNAGSSCLSWYGGNMPPGTPVLSDDAVKHMTAWAKAGGFNN